MSVPIQNRVQAQPRAARSSPEQPRAAQNSPEQPRAAQSSPEQPRAAQGSPGQPRAAQSRPEQPKAASACANMYKNIYCREGGGGVKLKAIILVSGQNLNQFQ